MSIHGDKSSDKGPNNRMEKIITPMSKVLKDNLEEKVIGRESGMRRQHNSREMKQKEVFRKPEN